MASDHRGTADNFRYRGIFQRVSLTNQLDTISFDDEWVKFASICNVKKSLEDAWEIFAPVMAQVYASVSEFSLELFSALQASLALDIDSNMPESTSYRRAFALKGRRIGFAMNIDRLRCLGFPGSYGASLNSVYDHACMVFRKTTKSRESPQSPGFCFDDVITSVEIEMSDTNCQSFATDEEPDLASNQGALGQALLGTMDSYHCLVRRGIRTRSLPVMIIAGKKRNETSAKLWAGKRLRCLEGCLYVPQTFGDRMSYDWHRQIKFDDDKAAIAIYLRTMRVGVELATQVESQHEGSRLSPVSLCGEKLRIGEYELPKDNLSFVASPIPDAYEAKSKCEKVLVKVSYAGVHRVLVPHNLCWTALEKLHDKGSPELKASLAKILLACAVSHRDNALTNSMKDESESYKALRPCDLHTSGHMSCLWAAFSRLVEDILVPMAEAEVIHVDIRSGWKTTYNILCRREGDEIKLILIDYDSLVLAMSADIIPENKTSVAISSLPYETWSAMKFVWWQVLWMAYVWNTQCSDDPKFQSFARRALRGDDSFSSSGDDDSVVQTYNSNFNALLKESGIASDAIVAMARNHATTGQDVKELLHALSPAFPRTKSESACVPSGGDDDDDGVSTVPAAPATPAAAVAALASVSTVAESEAVVVVHQDQFHSASAAAAAAAAADAAALSRFENDTNDQGGGGVATGASGGATAALRGTNLKEDLDGATARSNHPLDSSNNNNETSVSDNHSNSNQAQTEASVVVVAVKEDDIAAASVTAAATTTTLAAADTTTGTTTTIAVGGDGDPDHPAAIVAPPNETVGEEEEETPMVVVVVYLAEDPRSRQPCLQRHVYTHTASDAHCNSSSNSHHHHPTSDTAAATTTTTTKGVETNAPVSSSSSLWYLDAVVPSKRSSAAVVAAASVSKKSTRGAAMAAAVTLDPNGSTTANQHHPPPPNQHPQPNDEDNDTTATTTLSKLLLFSVVSPTTQYQQQYSIHEERRYQRLWHDAKLHFLPRLVWYAIVEECQVAWYHQKSNVHSHGNTGSSATNSHSNSRSQQQHSMAMSGKTLGKHDTSMAATTTTTTTTTGSVGDVDLDTCFCLPVSFTPASLAHRIQQGCLWMARQQSVISSSSSSSNNSQQQQDHSYDKARTKAPRGRPPRSNPAAVAAAEVVPVVSSRDGTIPLVKDVTPTTTMTNSVTQTTTTKAAVSNAVGGPTYLSAQLGGRVAMALMQPKEDWMTDRWNDPRHRRKTAVVRLDDTVDEEDNDIEEEGDKGNEMQDETATIDNEGEDDEYLVTDDNGTQTQQQGGDGETSDVMDETQLILNNPYLQPSTAEIVAWMGHFGSKVFTTAAIQEAMVGQPGMVWAAKPGKLSKTQKRTRALIGSTTGIPVREVLSETDTFVWSELLLLRSNSDAATASLSTVAQRNESDLEHSVVDATDGALPTAPVANFVFGEAKHNHDTVRLVMQIAGEGLTPTTTLKEMMEWETAAFGRTQFTVRIVNDKAWDALYHDVTEQAASRLQAQKTQRAWEAYRSRGVQTGFCEWGRSSWFEAVGASSVMASVAVVASSVVAPVSEAAGEMATINATAATDITATSLDDSDFALAQSLAADQMEAGDDLAGRGAGRRRKTRRAGESAGVYYGNQSNLTQKQLMDAMLRFISLSSFSSHQKPFQPLTALLKSIPDDSADPMRRIRTALGRLLYKRNQLSRINVQTEWSDLQIWKALQETPLWMSPSTPDAPLEEMVSGSTEASLNLAKEMKRLVNYIQMLHQTELQLRRMVMKRLSDIPIALIACAADDRAGSMDSMDDIYFDDAAKVEWQSTGHAMLSRRIFRPSSRHETDASSPCYWYQLTSFVSSLPSLSPEVAVNPLEKTNIGRAKEPTGVERRIRFLATPVDPNVVDQSPLILTEGQVKAGLKAAELNESQSETSPSFNNPFASGELQDISLFPPSGSLVQPITGCVVGHNRYMDETNEVVHKILILPNRDAPNEEAFWGILNFSSVSGAIECNIDGQSDIFTIQQFDYHPSSQAFQECLDIVKYLQRHPKGTVFQEPVDPIALGIPDYPSVVKTPMDVSTLLQKLERGEYSHIPPSHMKGYSPVARMLNGPFRKDVERIFDNAMLFNPPKDWIHQAASVVKKAVIKKIEQVSSTLIGSVGRQRKQNSMYMEYDSDVDIYVYESDPDEDYGTSRKRAKRPNANTKSPAKEDGAARGIERGIPMQKLLGESFGLRGPLANLPIITNAADFTLPTGWKCRHKRQADDGILSPQPSQLQQQSTSELDDLMCLHRLVQERDQVGLRRSTRASDDVDVDVSREKSTPTNTVEYDFMWDLNVTKLPGNRVEVEMACERLHETYFAKLFQSHGNDLEAANVNTNGWGRFFEGSFPPFLGRIVPMTPGLSANDDISSWEIREHNIVPSLRWILRGLLHTEHVTLLGGSHESSNDMGVLLPSHVYYVDDTQIPFDVVDVRELTRRKRANNNNTTTADGGGNSSDDDVELSAYEKARAERVARNAERLQSLGLG